MEQDKTRNKTEKAGGALDMQILKTMKRNCLEFRL
jgi:hypothetical protein